MEHRITVGSDVIVIGGGHAGVEAALAAARVGVRVTLLTSDTATIGAMSCNPAIGGIGKGHLVCEIDVLGGVIAQAADRAAIHHRMLNRSKGPAVHGPRIQADRKLFKAAVQAAVAAQRGVQVVEATARELLLEDGELRGVVTDDGHVIRAKAVILATGTFLGGQLHCGLEKVDGGRIGAPGSHPLARQLKQLGLPLARLKTGTPPRLDGRTIDWSQLAMQASDEERWTLSPLSSQARLPQIACGITRTGEAAHDLIRRNLDRSPLYSGMIKGIGPRYCPSIEDKVIKFGDRSGHQVFLEPEGLDDTTIYPNGISTSLPEDVQVDLVQSLPGLAQAKIVQPGYAVEYNHLDPRILNHGLSVRTMPGLYCAGQINGTTGYEEAAAQGLVAGLNAARFCQGEAHHVFERDASYIGVMVDDLVLQGVTEPYRMLTSRAEFRLHLRADNAVMRLGRTAQSLGLVGGTMSAWIDDRLARHAACSIALLGHREAILQGCTVDQLLQAGPGERFADILATVHADIIYEPYVQRQRAEQARLGRSQDVRLGKVDFSMIAGLSIEMVERLSSARPATLAEAARIRGVTPSALTAVLAAASRLR